MELDSKMTTKDTSSQNEPVNEEKDLKRNVNLKHSDDLGLGDDPDEGKTDEERAAEVSTVPIKRYTCSDPKSECLLTLTLGKASAVDARPQVDSLGEYSVAGLFSPSTSIHFKDVRS